MIFAPMPSTVPEFACETVSGRYVDVVNPNPSDITITDMSWSISRQSRYAGHTLGEPYSVAQHSCFTLELIEMAISDDFAGHPFQLSLQKWMGDKYSKFGSDSFLSLTRKHTLIHDCTEAYLVDLPSPVKRHPALREVYTTLENGVYTAIEKALNLRPRTEDIVLAVRWADAMALQIEAANLMPSRGRGWSGNLPEFQLEFIHYMPKIMPWHTANAEFLKTFEEVMRT